MGDALELGSNWGNPWGFESPLSHQRRPSPAACRTAWDVAEHLLGALLPLGDVAAPRALPLKLDVVDALGDPLHLREPLGEVRARQLTDGGRHGVLAAPIARHASNTR